MIKYIFCINTGRCGSNYLGTMLEHCEGISARHEPEPIMNDKPMKSYLMGKPRLLKSLMPKKIAQIQSDLKDAKIYLESNHTFIKGFGWLLMQHIPQEEIGVIILKRDKEKVRDSFFRIKTSPLNKLGHTWLMPASMKNKLCQPKKSYHLETWWISFIESYFNKRFLKIKKGKYIENCEKEALEWYIDETYAQAEKFKNKFPNVSYYETSTESLNKIEEYQNIFTTFKLEFKPKKSFFDKLGIKTNLKV